MNDKHRSELPMYQNIKVLEKVQPCYVLLTRIGTGAYSGDKKDNSLISKQIMGITFTKNKVHSEDTKDSNVNSGKYQNATKMLSEFVYSECPVELIHNASASSYFKSETACNYSVIKPCYVKLKRLIIPSKRYQEIPENIIKNSKRHKSSECVNYQNGTSNSKYLANRKVCSLQSDDANSRLNDSHDIFSAKVKLKPCSVRLCRWTGNETISELNHEESGIKLNDCQSQFVEVESIMSESFISESLLSTPKSSVGSVINNGTIDSDDSTVVLFLNSLESAVNKNIHNHIAREKLTTACSSLEFDAHKEVNESSDSCNFKYSVKRKVKLLSSDSSELSTSKKEEKSNHHISECNTVQKSENYYIKKKERTFSKRGHGSADQTPYKRVSSHTAAYVDSSSDTSSALFNNSIDVTYSSKLIAKRLKKRNIESHGSTSVSHNRTSADRNAVKEIKPVLCEQNRNSSDITTRNNDKSSAGKYGSPYKLETEENFSDDYYSKSNKNATADKVKYKRPKHHFSKRKHFMINGTHLSSKGECEIKLMSVKEKSSFSHLPSKKLKNSESEKKCKVDLINYNIKPCCVILNRVEKIDLLSKRNASIPVEDECSIHTKSESVKNYSSKCSEHANGNSVDQLQNPNDEFTHRTSANNLDRKHFLSSLDDSDESLPDISKINALKQQNKSVARKLSFENDDSVIGNGSRIVKDHETDVINKNDAIDISNAKNKISSSGNNESVKLSVNYESDNDDAYFADTDDCSESDVCVEKKPISEENEDENAQRINIPYCCLETKDLMTRSFDGIFVFRSKTNGSVYIVDLFEFDNITKMFVTIHMGRKAHVFTENVHKENNLKTVSERLNALGCFDEENAKIHDRHPFIFTSAEKNYYGNEGKILETECPSSPDSFDDSVSKDDFSCGRKSCAKSHDDDCSQLEKPSSSQTSCLKNSSVSEDGYDNSDNHCVHCLKKFADRKENFNHTCKGKLERGFLCEYCEKIFSSYFKLLSHKKTHFL